MSCIAGIRNSTRNWKMTSRHVKKKYWNAIHSPQKQSKMEQLSNQISENGLVRQVQSSAKFIQANTEVMALETLREQHIIPVFVKDNQPTISQLDFIDTTVEIASSVLGSDLRQPAIRVSHPIKGRIPEARNKPAEKLEEWEKTIYYERMAFILEIPSITANINGQELMLTVGGVKAYNLDNLYNYGGSLQRFKVFIGFKVKVCTNLCIWSDGYQGELRVRSLDELAEQIHALLSAYRTEVQLEEMQQLTHYELTEHQFAQLIGRTRMYNFLPKQRRQELPELLLSDTQIAGVTKAYYQDKYFKADTDGSINLWKLYNLFTASVKSSYIDTFLDRNANAGQFINQVADALDGGKHHWFLS